MRTAREVCNNSESSKKLKRGNITRALTKQQNSDPRPPPIRVQEGMGSGEGEPQGDYPLGVPLPRAEALIK